ncbi:MAG: glycosyltransferase [Blautia sp.]|nr:glycosyltransferase [Blautia sp.]
MEELVLSICMPVYNGGERMYANIKGILESNDQRFEIVVCDNGSTDDGIKKLQNLSDERLHIYVNEKNIGPLENGLKALSVGKGKYLMLLLDRDILQVEYLVPYIQMLERMQAGVILNLCAHAGVGDNCLLRSPEDAAYWLTEGPHQSYYTYLRQAFQEIPITEWIKKDGYYPASCGLLIQRNYEVVLQRQYPIVIAAEMEYVYMTTSRTHEYAFEKKIDIVKKGGVYDEVSVYNRFRDYIYFIKEQWECVDKAVVLGIYQGNLKTLVPGYFYMVQSPVLCHRYHIPDKKYTVSDYKKLAFWFYRKAKRVIREQGMWSLPLQWKMWWATWKCRQKFCREICN